MTFDKEKLVLSTSVFDSNNLLWMAVKAQFKHTVPAMIAHCDSSSGRVWSLPGPTVLFAYDLVLHVENKGLMAVIVDRYLFIVDISTYAQRLDTLHRLKIMNNWR